MIKFFFTIGLFITSLAHVNSTKIFLDTDFVGKNTSTLLSPYSSIGKVFAIVDNEDLPKEHFPEIGLVGYTPKLHLKSIEDSFIMRKILMRCSRLIVSCSWGGSIPDFLRGLPDLLQLTRVDIPVTVVVSLDQGTDEARDRVMADLKSNHILTQRQVSYIGPLTSEGRKWS